MSYNMGHKSTLLIIIAVPIFWILIYRTATAVPATRFNIINDVWDFSIKSLSIRAQIIHGRFIIGAEIPV